MKPDIIIVRYSELFLKSDYVRNKLQKKLSDNIRNGMKIQGIEGELIRQRGRIFLKTHQIEKTIELLKHIFGIVSISPSLKIELKNIEDFIRKNSEELIKGNSFAIRVKRSGEHDFTSQELAAKLGQIVVDKTGKEVDLEEPHTKLNVEVRDRNAYIFTKKIDGPGGMPLGSQGEVNCYIDSREALVACWLMMKRGSRTQIYHTFPTDVLDRWSYGVNLDKIKVGSVDEVDSKSPLVLGINLEKDGMEKIKQYEKKFETILSPVVAFTKDEIDEIWGKINK
jgi:thiamine biosynthesis protein ThiI